MKNIQVSFFFLLIVVSLTNSLTAQMLPNSENYFDSYYINVRTNQEDEEISLPPKKANSTVIIENHESRPPIIKLNTDIKELSGIGRFTQHFLVKSVTPDFAVENLYFYKVIATVYKNKSVERDLELSLIYKDEMLWRFSVTLPNDMIYQYVFYNED
jgi:hypothetical protein